MKFTKLSLIAVLAVTTAMAGDAKISGDVKVFYGTDDIGNHDLFNKNGAIGDVAASLDYSRSISDMVTINAGATYLSTLGLENTLVSGTWVAHGGATTPQGVKDKAWIDTLNVVIKPIDKTMLVVGRQELDTPLAFSEKWNIASNAFDAAVIVDNHIENTTLVGAWVGRGNGHNGIENVSGGMSKYGALTNGTPAADGTSRSQRNDFQGQGINIENSGAYAAGAITKAIPNTTAQAWYYNVVNQANAMWLQADTAVTKELGLGAQYSQIMPKGAIDSNDDTKAFALKANYKVAGLDLTGAYSEVDDKGLIYMGNTATGGAFNGQSKLYTDAWWNLGFVGQVGAKTGMVSAGYDLGSANLTAQYTTVSNDTNKAGEMDEVTLTATTKVGPFDTTLALINTSADNNDAIDGNTVQVYLTAPFSL